MGSIDGNNYGGASLTIVFEDKDVSSSTGVALFGWMVNAEVMYLDANFVYNNITKGINGYSGALAGYVANTYIGDCNFTIDGKITTEASSYFAVVAAKPTHWDEDLAGSTTTVENVIVSGQF